MRNITVVFFAVLVTAVSAGSIQARDLQLDYSTYLGGIGDDGGYGIAVDQDGYAYIGGWTGSNNLPTTPGAYQTIYGGGNFTPLPPNSIQPARPWSFRPMSGGALMIPPGTWLWTSKGASISWDRPSPPIFPPRPEPIKPRWSAEGRDL